MRCIKDSDIGARLRKLRLNTGAKMIDMAVEFDISMAQYSRLESGIARISVDVLDKACKYYDCTINYILFGQKNTCESIFFRNYKVLKKKILEDF